MPRLEIVVDTLRIVADEKKIDGKDDEKIVGAFLVLYTASYL